VCVCALQAAAQAHVTAQAQPHSSLATSGGSNATRAPPKPGVVPLNHNQVCVFVCVRVCFCVCVHVCVCVCKWAQVTLNVCVRVCALWNVLITALPKPGVVPLNHNQVRVFMCVCVCARVCVSMHVHSL